MGFRQADSEGRGGYARVWSVEDKGNYSVCQISTSKKRKEDNSYEVDFQDGFVRFIGSAHEKIKAMDIDDRGVSIQITSCETTTAYDAETKKKYTNFAVFAFDIPEENDGGSATTSKKTTTKASTKTKTKKEEVVEEDEDDLPF